MLALTSRLTGLAAQGATITYGEVAREFGLRIKKLALHLEHVMDADHAAGRPMLAAVCTGKLTHSMPAEGFFIKALELGIDIPDRAAFVIAERAALRALYGGATPPA